MTSLVQARRCPRHVGCHSAADVAIVLAHAVFSAMRCRRCSDLSRCSILATSRRRSSRVHGSVRDYLEPHSLPVVLCPFLLSIDVVVDMFRCSGGGRRDKADHACRRMATVAGSAEERERLFCFRVCGSCVPSSRISMLECGTRFCQCVLATRSHSSSAARRVTAPRVLATSGDAWHRCRPTLGARSAGRLPGLRSVGGRGLPRPPSAGFLLAAPSPQRRRSKGGSVAASCQLVLPTIASLCC